MQAYYTNYSNGWVIELSDKAPCDSWILLPAENLWPAWVRGVLYIVFLIYIFFGVAIGSDVFMMSIEAITSKKRTIKYFDFESQTQVEKEILVWNETVANLTLMALGSSAPEILLYTFETIFSLGDPPDDGLGTFTIVGSAAFNLFIITAICVVSIPTGEYKRIREVGVFILTAIWSLWAYVWMLLVIQVISPGVVEPWEAWLTLFFFPLLVLSAWATDCGWWCHKCKRKKVADGSEDDGEVETKTKPPTPMRILGHEAPHQLGASGLGVEFGEKIRRKSISLQPAPQSLQGAAKQVTTLNTMTKIIATEAEKKAFARASRAWFRHAAVSSMLGGAKRRFSIRRDSDASSTGGGLANVVLSAMNKNHIGTADEDVLGKFTFGSSSYSVLESAGHLEVDVLFYRMRPGKSRTTLTVPNGAEPTVIRSVVSVDFETREGSAIAGKKFKHVRGTLTFAEDSYQQKIRIPIIDDVQFEENKDFFILLKNPEGDAKLGDPSVCRVIIIDDDTPGEFQFTQRQYCSPPGAHHLSCVVSREHGSDGVVKLEYTTIEGSAKSGEAIKEDVDFVGAQSGVVEFRHGETEKTVSVTVNAESKGKSFILCLKNPGLGAKIGSNSAAMCFIGEVGEEAKLVAAVAEDDEEEETWAGQFRAAMQVGDGETDEQGKPVPPTGLQYFLHFLSFLWKVLFACCPPRKYCHAFPAFIVSLLLVGGLTIIIEQVGHLLTCVIGLRTSVAGITVIALGTSLPDTFASRTAAKQDDYADAAIGNVTGSNSVNVFLGLGLPWVISTMYHLARGSTYQVKSQNLYQSVIIYSACAVVCLVILFVRRKMGGELGGGRGGQWLTFVVFCLLWCIYIVVTSLKAYEVINF